MKIDIPSFEVNIFSTFMFSFSAIFLMCSTASSGNCSILNNTYSFDSVNGIYLFLRSVLILNIFLSAGRGRGEGVFYQRSVDEEVGFGRGREILRSQSWDDRWIYISESFIYNIHICLKIYLSITCICIT